MPQGGELGVDPVQPWTVRWRVGDLDVAQLRPVRDPSTLLRDQVRGEVVAYDRQPHFERVERAQIATDLAELRPRLGRLAVPIDLVRGQVIRGEQVPYPVRSVVGCAPAPRRLTVGVSVRARRTARTTAQMRLPVQQAELVETENYLRLARLGRTWPSAIADRCSTRALLTWRSGSRD